MIHSGVEFLGKWYRHIWSNLSGWWSESPGWPAQQGRWKAEGPPPKTQGCQPHETLHFPLLTLLPAVPSPEVANPEVAAGNQQTVRLRAGPSPSPRPVCDLCTSPVLLWVCLWDNTRCCCSQPHWMLILMSHPWGCSWCTVLRRLPHQPLPGTWMTPFYFLCFFFLSKRSSSRMFCFLHSTCQYLKPLTISSPVRLPGCGLQLHHWQLCGRANCFISRAFLCLWPRKWGLLSGDSSI